MTTMKAVRRSFIVTGSMPEPTETEQEPQTSEPKATNNKPPKGTIFIDSCDWGPNWKDGEACAERALSNIEKLAESTRNNYIAFMWNTQNDLPTTKQQQRADNAVYRCCCEAFEFTTRKWAYQPQTGHNCCPYVVFD